MNKNTGRYLKYAVGEIVLVVTGILIAFAISYWNQGRLARLEEQKLLTNIKVDFDEAVRNFKGLNTRRDEALVNFIELIRVAESKKYDNEIHIDTLLAKTVFTPTYNGKSSSLSILVNSGKINLLSNDKLKSLLLSWPQQVEDMTEGEFDGKKLTNETWIPFISEYTSTNDWFKHYNDFESLPTRTRNSRVEKNYAGMFNDRKFENTLTQLELLYIAGKRETARLINNAEEITKIIEQELKN